MGSLGRLWNRWVAWCARDEDARPLAAVRILVPLCVVVDLMQTWWLDLVDVLFASYKHGGIAGYQGGEFVLGAYWGAAGGPLAWWLTLVSMALVSAGVAVRPALVVGIFAYAQLGHSSPDADRGIDTIIRTVLLLLLFSNAHRRWSLGNLIWTNQAADRIRAWPADLIKLLLMLIYFSAGFGKVLRTVNWTAWSGQPVLYNIMVDPMAAKLDPVFWESYWPLFRVGGWVTIAFELTPFLIFTRFCPYWAIPAALMHIGIASTMYLGMFSYAMLSMYPLLFAVWWLPWIDRFKDSRAPPAGVGSA